MLLSRLPVNLEDAAALLKRRKFAEDKKHLWRSTYRDAYQFAMPARRRSRGIPKVSKKIGCCTIQRCKKRRTRQPTRYARFCSAVDAVAELTLAGHNEAGPGRQAGNSGRIARGNKAFFSFLNASNFGTVISEAALDLQVGTCALSFDEGDQDNPLFSSLYRLVLSS